MRILYLAHRIPFPPNKGDKLRAFRQIEHLARRHEIWCACFVDRQEDRLHEESLRRYCYRLETVQLSRKVALLRGCLGLVRGQSLTETFYSNPMMAALLREWSASVRFDAVVAFSSSMASYALRIPAKRRILDLCDVDSAKWSGYAAMSHGPLRWLYNLESKRLAAGESNWIRMFDKTLLITQGEVSLLDATIPREKIAVVGNGVGIRKTKRYRKPVTSRGLTPTAQIVGFVGNMDYRPNVDAVRWFVQTCWPAIRKAVPQAVFRIVGRSAVRSVRKLARIESVEVVGEVKSVAEHVDRFAVSVAPMRIARGLQNKVLEAMAAGKPVVLTSKAAEGIDAQDGREFVVADKADEIAKTVTRLLKNARMAETIGLAARRFVSTRHRWEDELAKFEAIVTGTVTTALADESSAAPSGRDWFEPLVHGFRFAPPVAKALHPSGAEFT